MIPMNITLPPDSERFLRDQLAAGKLPSADDVIAEALRRMREHELNLDELRREIAVGIDNSTRAWPAISMKTRWQVSRPRLGSRQHE
jgi:putative addiction module CopG family antidote